MQQEDRRQKDPLWRLQQSHRECVMRNKVYAPFRLTLVAIACGVMAWAVVISVLVIVWKAVQ
jgi:hypothetical protein